MDLAKRYAAYAQAFDLTCEDDDWSRLEEFFTEDACYRPDGTPASEIVGRKAIFEYLKQDLDAFDRRMNKRTLSFLEPHRVEGDRVISHWEMRCEKQGLPDLVFKGCETAIFEGDRIGSLSDAFEPDQIARIESWRADHGDVLG